MSAVIDASTRLALAIDAARLGSWTWDAASGITTWEERLEEMHGLPPGGFGGTFEDWVAALHPDDRADCLARVQAALADPSPYILLHRSIWPDGSIHSIECRGTVLVDADNTPIGTTGVAIDVTLREHLVHTLQRALLPSEIPTVPGTRVAARYRPSETRSEVGGDWYAVIALPDGRLVVGIGDVAGHGLDAVAHMASARFSLRALALTETDPGTVLTRLGEVIRTFEHDPVVTATYGVLDPTAGTYTWATAGHPPAVVRSVDGTARLLEARGGPPLGLTSSTYRSASTTIAPGATLVLYTDGLVERRGVPINDGLERLQDACADAPSDPSALCEKVLAAPLDDAPNQDDVAILAVTLD